MSDLLTEAPSECLAPLVGLVSTLAKLAIVPASINVEWRYTSQTDPYLRVWFRYRTEFERAADALGLKWSSQSTQRDQRLFSTKNDKGPLLQCMSFAHHDDWDHPTHTLTNGVTP